jgi:hypothetical protein
MGVLYHPGSDPSRVYYGTDTRAFALLIGAVLALLWPGQKLSGAVSPWKHLGIDLAGCSGLIIVLVMMWRTNQYETFLYHGGLLLLSAATAALVAALAHPASRLGKVFGWEPLRWLGERSYGIYLCHYADQSGGKHGRSECGASSSPGGGQRRTRRPVLAICRRTSPPRRPAEIMGYDARRHSAEGGARHWRGGRHGANLLPPAVAAPPW